jgi:hypothetical protein
MAFGRQLSGTVLDVGTAEKQLLTKDAEIMRRLRVLHRNMVEIVLKHAERLSPRSDKEYARKGKHFQDKWKHKLLAPSQRLLRGWVKNSTPYAAYLEDERSKYREVAKSPGNPEGVPSPLQNALKQAGPEIDRAKRAALAGV